MDLIKNMNRNNYFLNPWFWSKSGSKAAIEISGARKLKNLGLLGFVSATAMGCNVSDDDQCYGGLGVIVGKLCASSNDIIANPTVKLVQITSEEPYALTTAVDTIEFDKANKVSGTKYTLTEGDILVNPGVVSLNLINSGSIDGQTIFGADEIELETQGTSVVLTSDWNNNRLISVKNSDQSVILNDLQASNLDSAKADDMSFYPGTDYRIDSVDAPQQSIILNFNEEAILGTSTEVELTISNSKVGIQAGVFTNPDAVAVVAPLVVDPFAVAMDTNIENLTIKIADTTTTGSVISDLIFSGLETLTLTGGNSAQKFEITDPLDVSLVRINARDVPSDLFLTTSDSVSQKTVFLGSGNDILKMGDSLVAKPGSDQISAGLGADRLFLTFEGIKNVSPTLSSFETFDLAFNGESTLDLFNTLGLDTINILESSSGVALTSVPFDLSKFNVSGAQAGSWTISYEDNAASTVNLNWSNDTGLAVSLTNLAFDEVRSLSITVDGSNSVEVAALTTDPDDTKLISFTNTNDGNLNISPVTQVETLDAVTNISLTTTESGNISLGSAISNFGISDAPKLSTIALVASQTGDVELGSIGTTTAVEDLQSISVTSSGANVTIGSIIASKTGTFSAAVSSSATIAVGVLNFENQGASFLVSGSGTLGPISFLNEAFSIINLSDLVTNTTVTFPNANTGVALTSGSGNDIITPGLGVDVLTGGEGADVFVINDGTTGITVGTADKISDFKFGNDKLKLGLAGDSTVDTGNYIENSSGVADYTAALNAANVALNTLNSTSAALKLYAFEFDNSSGYLFIDNDSDGVAEGLVVLSGVESTTISAGDIIA